MKVAIALLCTLAVAIAGPVQDVIPILSQEASVEHDGKFHYSYETGNGIQAQSQGELKVFDKDSAGVVSQGSYRYTGDDGQTYTITYTADENGYHPEGAHLPVAPPVPEAIARSLAYIAAHPVQEVAKRI